MNALHADDIPDDVWLAAHNAVEAMPERMPWKFEVERAIANAIMAERERASIAAGNYLMLRTPLDVPRIVECEEAIRTPHSEASVG